MSGAHHAACVVLGEDGVLISGASGSGKSRLARRLVDLVREQSGYGCLIGDDRIRLVVAGGRLVAGGHPVIAGQAEIREVGIVTVPFEPAAVIRLMVELSAAPVPRMPPAPDPTLRIEGVAVPLLRLGPQHSADDAARLVLARLAEVGGTQA